MKRKKDWIGHVMTNEGLLKIVLDGRIKDKRTRGKPRMDMIDDLIEGT